MEASVRTKKMIASGIALLVVLTVISSVYFFLTDRTIKSNLNSEKLKNEHLLSEKLEADKKISELNQSIQSQTAKNSQAESLIAAAKIGLAEKEYVISGLKKENATVKNLNKQLAEYHTVKTNLIKQVDEMEAKNQKLILLNEDFQSINARLSSENNMLSNQVEQIRNQSLLKADNYQVEAFRNIKKEKITIRAKRAKMISVALDVPWDSASEIKFTITTPDGEVINEKDKALSWEITTQDRYLMASVNPLNDEFMVTHQVRLTYQPANRLKGGIYKIGILNKDGEKLGNCRVHLK